MLYLSQVLGRPIIDLEGERVATLKDVIVRLGEGIDSADVGYLATDAATVQLKSSRGKLARLHPVEIARLAEAFSYQQGAEIVESLDDETAAETLEEMAAARQAQILGDMDEERAADILEYMSPDEAADVLGDLPEEKAEDLLNRMEDEEQLEVAELLTYADDTAGGLMTTEFVTLPRELTVG